MATEAEKFKSEAEVVRAVRHHLSSLIGTSPRPLKGIIEEVQAKHQVEATLVSAIFWDMMSDHSDLVYTSRGETYWRAEA